MVLEDSSKTDDEILPENEEEPLQETEPTIGLVPEESASLSLQPLEGEPTSSKEDDETVPSPAASPARVRSPSIAFSTDTSTDEVSRKPKSAKKKSTTKREARLKEALATKEIDASPELVDSKPDPTNSLPEPVLDGEKKDSESDDVLSQLIDDEAVATIDEAGQLEDQAAEPSTKDAVLEEPQVPGKFPEPLSGAEIDALDDTPGPGASSEPDASGAAVTGDTAIKDTSEEVAMDEKAEATDVDIVQPDDEPDAVDDIPAPQENVAASGTEAEPEKAEDTKDDMIEDVLPKATSDIPPANEEPVQIEEHTAADETINDSEPLTDQVPEAPNESAATDTVASGELNTAVKLVHSSSAFKAKLAKVSSTTIDPAEGVFTRPFIKSHIRSKKSQSLTQSDLKSGSMKAAVGLLAIAAEAPIELSGVTKQGFIRDAPRRDQESDDSDDTDGEEEDLLVKTVSSHGRHDSGVAVLSKERKHKHRRSSQRLSISDAAIIVEDDSRERRRKHHHKEHKKQDERKEKVTPEDEIPRSTNGSSSARRHRKREASDGNREAPQSESGSARDRRGSKTSEEVKPPLRKLLSGIKKEVVRSFNPEFPATTSRGMVRSARK